MFPVYPPPFFWAPLTTTQPSGLRPVAAGNAQRRGVDLVQEAQDGRVRLARAGVQGRLELLLAHQDFTGKKMGNS